ncbi:flavodoxin-dependent (E)-4-hydroxy-3-methylbut-2-enyl-diphosphate synthase [Marispirochaeta sp.]|uniref:flavodoxin-dependent (E)-4-hydroxy-3-methylbut-2-enyl-diphosphate synthase n=1 Tax=Marispirochaeta sp. TaxID=2038653 RepID=UPI0029C8892D|nr:flavodoxin-dependent (E)-4-hydroxy-3-methylbut-2-enyl-diphosphate synthase [Marispirochaeta sp.]
MNTVYSRENTRKICIGNSEMGGDSPVSIQTMWKRAIPADKEVLLKELRRFAVLGCNVIRFAVPDEENARLLAKIAPLSPIPVVADIHFDYRLALLVLDGVHKVRINPGNIGADWKVKEVLSKAADMGIPIRVGINGGSLPRKLRELPQLEGMIAAAENEIDLLEAQGFRNAVFSLKSSSAENTIHVNRRFASLWDYPLHLGVTEAGPMIPGIVKNTRALLQLLGEGIGSTIRVSLSAPEEDEVVTGREILREAGLRAGGVDIVSCPRCGRSEFPVHELVAQIQEELYAVKKPLTVAVMGCVVNGPEEARHADIGITGSGNEAIIFCHGELKRKIPMDQALEALREEIREAVEE